MREKWIRICLNFYGNHEANKGGLELSEHKRKEKNNKRMIYKRQKKITSLEVARTKTLLLTINRNALEHPAERKLLLLEIESPNATVCYF